MSELWGKQNVCINRVFKYYAKYRKNSISGVPAKCAMKIERWKKTTGAWCQPRRMEGARKTFIEWRRKRRLWDLGYAFFSQ